MASKKTKAAKPDANLPDLAAMIARDEAALVTEQNREANKYPNPAVAAEAARMRDTHASQVRMSTSPNDFRDGAPSDLGKTTDPATDALLIPTRANKRVKTNLIRNH